MIVEQLFIDGKEVDIKDTQIVRKYTTPYFSDVSKVFIDTTQTITFPQTERNKAVMEYLHEADMSTDFPYTIHRADYIVDGMQLIRNGEVKVLGDFEIQIVYGIDREVYLPLKETKLNEINPNGTTILESDWIVDWNYDTVTNPSSIPATAKFEFLNYVSGVRKSDAVVSGGIVQPPIPAPSPFLENQKAMTTHPYVSFNNLIDLVSTYGGISNTLFDTVKTRLENKGLLIGENKTDLVDTHVKTFITDFSYTFSTTNGLPLGFNPDLYVITTNVDSVTFYTNDYRFYVNKSGALSVKFNLKTDKNVTGIDVRFIGDDNTVLKTILKTKEDLYYYYFQVEFTVDMQDNGGIVFCPKGTGATTNVYAGSSIELKYNAENSIYILTPNTENLKGHFNILYNLPKQNMLEFIQQCLIMTGCVIGTGFQVSTYDDFKTNYDSGIYYDWSGKISDVKNSKYQFNSNAQKNWIRFENSDKLSYLAKSSVIVNDTTLTAEKDLNVIRFNLGERNKSDIIENISYEQTIKVDGTKVSFACDYKDANNVVVKKEYNDLVPYEVIPNNYAEINRNFIATPIIETFSFMVDSSPDYNQFYISGTGFENLSVGDVIIGSGLHYFAPPFAAVVSFDDETGLLVLDSDPGINVGELIHTRKSVISSNKFNIENYGDDESIKPKLGDELVSINYESQTGVFISNVDYSNINNPIFEITGYTFDSDAEYQVSIDIQRNGFLDKFYSVYQKLIERPIVKECNVLLDVYESANIDFRKPIYIKEWGKYCMLLELTAPNKGLCEAKLLLINQTL